MRHRLALIGHPVAHSRSADYFNRKFAADHINGSYRLLDMETLQGLENEVNRLELTGFNVTAPHKQSIVPHCKVLTETAQAIGAVNTVRVEDGLLVGHNTDAEGFADALRPLLQPHHKSVLVVGYGGAARAVAYACEKILALPYNIIYRHRNDDDFELSSQLIATHEVVVNCTPLGMHPLEDALPHLDYSKVTPEHLLFDLIYSPSVTRFMSEGRNRGATVSNGLAMLYSQAEAAWRFWSETRNQTR